jgi:hypothetical protein
MDIKALQLESRFSLPPNSLGYCGRNSAASEFKKCIIDGKCEGIEKEVENFIVLWPYLKTISQVTNLPSLSYEVIEAYWIGNDLLKKFKPEHYDLLLENFKKQGVPDFFVEELRQKRPKIFIPSHLFQVLHVGVGKASGAVPFDINSINNCTIRWGKVEEINKNKALINLTSLKIINKSDSTNIKYQMSNIKEEIPFNLKLVPDLKSGTTTAVHWDQVIKILTKEEEQKLSSWTREIIDSI